MSATGVESSEFNNAKEIFSQHSIEDSPSKYPNEVQSSDRIKSHHPCTMKSTSLNTAIQTQNPQRSLEADYLYSSERRKPVALQNSLDSSEGTRGSTPAKIPPPKSPDLSKSRPLIVACVLLLPLVLGESFHPRGSSINTLQTKLGELQSHCV